MKIVNSLKTKTANSAVALGFFDGIHKGHRAVIQEAVDCKSENLIPVVFTFTKSPSQIIKGTPAQQLSTSTDKQLLLQKIGVELLYCIDFCSIKDLSPESFVKTVLVDTLGAKKVFCGFNYHFGKGGEADALTLKKLCKKHNVCCITTNSIQINNETVSSTKIRECIKNGNVDLANKMLDSKFGFSAKIESGNHLGRTMDTPTINQNIPKNLVMPLFGVYASTVTIDEKTYIGATNIGVKPTIGSNFPVCETWLLNYKSKGESLYGKEADLRLEKFIRKEKKFESVEALKNQIKADGKTIYNYFSATT